MWIALFLLIGLNVCFTLLVAQRVKDSGTLAICLLGTTFFSVVVWHGIAYFATEWSLLKYAEVTLPGTLLISAIVSAAGGISCVRARHMRDLAKRTRFNCLGHPICTQCGYDLTGLKSPRCPECGESFITCDD